MLTSRGLLLIPCPLRVIVMGERDPSLSHGAAKQIVTVLRIVSYWSSHVVSIDMGHYLSHSGNHKTNKPRGEPSGLYVAIHVIEQ